MRKSYFFLSILVLLSLCFAFKGTSQDQKLFDPQQGNENMAPIKYIASFRTINAYCAAIVNGMEIIDNYDSSSGTMTTGFNATAYLENGDNNIEVLFGSLDARAGITKHRPGALCEFKLTAAFPDHEVELTSITATGDSDGVPTNILSEKYPEKHRTSEVQDLGYLPDSRLFKMERGIVLQNVPNWAWTTATPLQDTPENYKRLKQAYLLLSRIFEKNDLNAFRSATGLAMKEYAEAEGCEQEYYFESTGAIDLFNSGTSGHQITDWSDYRFESFLGGRIVRLATYLGDAPLTYLNGEGVVKSYQPYFSMINGKLVIIR